MGEYLIIHTITVERMNRLHFGYIILESMMIGHARTHTLPV